MHQGRLLVQEGIGPALEHTALPIDGEMPAPGIQDDLDIFSLQPLAHFESLTEPVDMAIEGDLPDERYSPGSHW